MFEVQIWNFATPANSYSFAYGLYSTGVLQHQWFFKFLIEIKITPVYNANLKPSVYQMKHVHEHSAEILESFIGVLRQTQNNIARISKKETLMIF